MSYASLVFGGRVGGNGGGGVLTSFNFVCL
jgi:hypothetical protein